MFAAWIDRFIAEKGINPNFALNVTSKNGTPNRIPVGCVVDLMKQAPAHEQRAIKGTLVKIDYAAGDPLHFFTHLAGAVAQDF